MDRLHEKPNMWRPKPIEAEGRKKINVAERLTILPVADESNRGSPAIDDDDDDSDGGGDALIRHCFRLSRSGWNFFGALKQGRNFPEGSSVPGCAKWSFLGSEWRVEQVTQKCFGGRIYGFLFLAVIDQLVLDVNESASVQISKSAISEGLIASDSFPQYYSAGNYNIEFDRTRSDHISIPGTMNDASFVEKHWDVSEEEGWITIPHAELLTILLNGVPFVSSGESLELHGEVTVTFVQESSQTRGKTLQISGHCAPGTVLLFFQVHILACLSASEQEEVITPFKFSAVMSKNDTEHGTKRDNAVENGEASYKGETSPRKDISDDESLLRTEDQKRKTKRVLQRFKNSHFFVRFADSGDALWSRRITRKLSSNPSRADAQNVATMSNSTDKHPIGKNGTMDQGNFDVNAPGGMARNFINCFSLTNGDIVVVLQVNIGDDFLQDPFIEIRQFERRSGESFSDQKDDNLLNACNEPCGELLTWLFPLDNTFSAARSPSPPPLSSSGIGSTSQRSNFSSSLGSQIFSFGNFRSYSMSSLPQSMTQATAPVTTPSSKSNFELEDRDRYSGKKLSNSQIAGKEGLLSFRGVLLEPERFSVCCGLEGVYIPGRRWRRKLKVIQPVEIHSFPAVCNTDDLLCVQIKNVSPVHIPEIVVYIDAITIVLGETTWRVPPLSLPIASIEVGDDHTLPNLPLRRGEEHSFILKPAISSWKNYLSQDRIGAHSSHAATSNALKWSALSKLTVGKESGSNTDRYSIVVSCRCNASESRLFFKMPINWQPRMSSDIMISVACKMSMESNGRNSLVSQLPVQVLTLKASNLTSEDLTMTILAPDSFPSPPSVLSLNSSPTSPASPLMGFSNASEISRNQASLVSDAIPSAGFGCSHLWLQSRVPLGCVPSQSTATIKLELLPLTDGIITLDTLQIDVKERGVTYIPEHALKIIATSSISAGVS